MRAEPMTFSVKVCLHAQAIYMHMDLSCTSRTTGEIKRRTGHTKRDLSRLAILFDTIFNIA